MIAPRWRKVVRDLWSNKTRTFLVLLSIAVGVTAIGIVLGAQTIVNRNLPEAYAAINPSSGTLFSLDTFDEEMVESILSMPEVSEAEGRRFVNVRFLNKAGEWRSLQVNAIPDYENVTINKIKPQEGAYPPPDQEMLIERASLSAALGLGDVEIGDTITIEPPDGKQRQIRVAGTVHDMSQLPAFINGAGYAYVNYETLEWLGEPRDFNQVVFVAAENKLDYDHVNTVSKEIQERMERSGINVLFAFVPVPGEHPAQTFITALSYILTAIGILSLVLGGFLIINTLSAILTQHVRQIGIMKAIGARASQVTLMYYALVLLFGVLALVIAVPLGALGAQGLASVFAGFLNFDIGGFRVDGRVMLIQAVISITAPLVAATLPILRGVRVTVREAVSEHGLGKGQFGSTFLDRLILGVRRVIPMGQPMQISLRNTFRRKARLTLTLITLSLASTIFISIFSIRASMQQTLNDALQLFDYDVQVVFDRSYRTERIRNELEELPGVDSIETWGFGSVRRVRPDETESDAIVLYAPHADSEMLHPTMISGRWLLPEDTNAIVINTDVLRTEEDVALGDSITLTIDGKERDWVVVGISRGLLTGANGFVNFDYYSRLTNDVGRAQISLVRLDDRSTENQAEYGQFIEQRYRDNGFRVQQMQTIAQLRTIIGTVFDVIIFFLLAMAVLLGAVGGLGLMGTMSINVLERSREIGVMRAIGASNGAVLRIVLVEGIIIGLISWTLGGLLAIPASQLLNAAVGRVLFQSSASYIFSTNGAIMWLGIVILLALLASYLPARQASSLTVREVLSYE